MPSTYSSLLRLELIGTGEQSGTWGATTNTNLGTLLDTAIAGTASFSVAAADVTLTANNGASDQARCMILRITGSPGVARNVIAPASSKVYAIKNGSDASVVIKTSTSTGVTIAAGATALVGYDTIASDFVFISPDTSTLITLTSTQTLTNKTLIAPVIATIVNTGTLTLPTSTDTLVGRATTDTLTNKTLTAPVISTIVNTGTLTLPTSTDTLVGRATTDTLTNKTLTAPVIATIVNTGTLTLPTSTDTLVGRATTDTLTNKTLTSPTIATITNGGTVTIPSGTDTLVARTSTDTLTNKRVTPRIGTVTSAATITPTADTADQYNVTALATAPTIAAPSGTPTDGQKLILRIKDNGTARALTWTTTSGAYRAVGVTLPTTTVLSKVVYVGCVYNSQDTYWDVVAVAQL